MSLGRGSARSLAVAVVVTGLLSATSCTRVACAEFTSSSSGEGSGGRSTPLAAAESFTTQNDTGDFADSGWREDGRDENGVTLRSGEATLHAVQGRDGTWLVDSGNSCSSAGTR